MVAVVTQQQEVGRPARVARAAWSHLCAPHFLEGLVLVARRGAHAAPLAVPTQLSPSHHPRPLLQFAPEMAILMEGELEKKGRVMRCRPHSSKVRPT